MKLFRQSVFHIYEMEKVRYFSLFATVVYIYSDSWNQYMKYQMS